MSQTYRAIQVVACNQFKLVDLPFTDPDPGHVRIRVEACGVCHSDTGTVEGVQTKDFPRVPGHEVVGRIDEVGAFVEGWKVGDRVGVGYLGGSCGHCLHCRGGDLVSCENQEFTGVQRDGGYAEVMIAKASGLIRVPDDLRAVKAAPLLCAGLTTFRALRNSRAKPGDRVAIIGIGGLGHLAVQFARRMGFEVVAIGRGPDKDAQAARLGAHHYLDSSASPIAEQLNSLGGVSLVVATASAGRAVADVVGGLVPNGQVIALGASPDPIELSSVQLIFGERDVSGSLTGDPATADATLRFSQMQGVAPMVEIVPLEQAPSAYAKMMRGEARFRMVLSMTG